MTMAGDISSFSLREEGTRQTNLKSSTDGVLAAGRVCSGSEVEEERSSLAVQRLDGSFLLQLDSGVCVYGWIFLFAAWRRVFCSLATYAYMSPWWVCMSLSLWPRVCLYRPRLGLGCWLTAARPRRQKVVTERQDIRRT